MRKVIYLFTLLFLLKACSQGKNSNKNQNLQTVIIDFANATIELPKSYKRTSISEYKTLLLNSDRPDNYRQVIMEKFEFIETHSTAFILYIDTTNYENIIWFQDGEYIRLTKSVSQIYLEQLEKRQEQVLRPHGISYERLESKIIASGNAQILKIKYELKHDDVLKYTTQYIVSSYPKTFAIMVNNLTNVDYQELVNAIKLK